MKNRYMCNTILRLIGTIIYRLDLQKECHSSHDVSHMLI